MEDMNMPAYDECYLDSMLKKHRYLFKLIGRYCEEDAFAVIEKIKAEDLYHKYYPLHEASLENVVEKLKKIY